MIQIHSNIESHGNEHQRIFHGDVLEVLSQIPDESVVGYGLDYDQRYRNLPYIGVISFE